MSNPNQIELGDRVRVEMDHDVFVGTVLYIPVATGDCWHLREKDNERLHYVQTFNEIVLIEKRVPSL